VLTWNTTNAATALIQGLGDVPTSGVKTVTPMSSTTYDLTAKGAGGSAEASVRITVNAAPPIAMTPINSISAEEEFKANVDDIFFNYDKYEIRGDAQATLASAAPMNTTWLSVRIAPTPQRRYSLTPTYQLLAFG